MPDFVLAFATYKFLKNFMFMISPYQFGKEQFNFVCVCVCVCVYTGLSKTLQQDNLCHCFPMLIIVGERWAVNLLFAIFPKI